MRAPNQAAGFVVGLFLGLVIGFFFHCWAQQQDWYFQSPLYELEKTIIPVQPCAA